MPRAALKDDEIAAFRRKAVRAATRLFAEHGYEAVTMRAIADKLGTSPMAPYRYFENKAEIFALVRAEATRAWSDTVYAELERDGAALERLLRARDAYVKFALKNPDQYRIIFDPHDEPAEKYPELAKENQRGLALMNQLGDLAIESGLYSGDRTTIAHLLWAHVHGLLSLHLSGKLQADRTLEQLLDASARADVRPQAPRIPEPQSKLARKRRAPK